MEVIWQNGEARLVERMSAVETDRHDWYVILFHFDELMEQYRSDYQIRIAVNLTYDLLRHFEGYICVGTEGFLAVMVRELTESLRNKLIFQLRYLYMDDPLAYSDEGEENPEFSALYDLEREYKPCRDYMMRRVMKVTRAQEKGIAQLPPPDTTELNPTRLVNAERLLSRLNVDTALRRQPICALPAHGQMREVIEEMYINISHLRDLLKAEYDLLSNKWLFKHITLLLDKRMLSVLGKEPKKHLSRPVSININVETLLSEEFTAFDAALSEALKISIVYEIHAMDIFADINAFHYARDRAQSKGYRVCLDGLTEETFTYINRERLSVDLVKLQWNADTTIDIRNEENLNLAKAIQKCGANRVILCRCDSQQAIDYGKALGISLFQGRHIDRLLDPVATLQN